MKINKIKYYKAGGIKLVIAIVFLFSFFGCAKLKDEVGYEKLQNHEEDLYVSPTGSDSNPGTQAAPFKTITKAASVIKPGNTVHVAPGTYTGGFETTTNGKAKARIRYVSDTKWGAKIVPTATSDHVWKNSGGYTDIIGFEITGLGITNISRLGIYLSGGNSSVQNCHVHNLATTIGCASDGGAGILGDNHDGAKLINYDFTGNLVHDIGGAPDGSCSQIHGIYLSAPGTIKNNIVYKIGGAGIHLWHDAAHVDIVNNTVFGCFTGILVGSGDFYWHTGPEGNNNVNNNIVMDNYDGITEESAGLGSGPNNLYKNNLSFRNAVCTVDNCINGTATGTIFEDPQFVNYIINGGGDYHLKSTSPALNAGVASLAPPTDFDGTARPQGIGFDIGAYEQCSVE